LVTIFIFAFTGVYLKYASVSQQLIVPKLEDLVYRSLKAGGNKLPAKVFDSNSMFLVSRLGRAPQQTRMASRWRGYIWALEKKWRVSR
jgi:hypothetical protein